MDVFAETVKAPEGVTILRGPLPVKSDSGVTYGTAQIQREVVTDYKTKAPTGEELVHLVVSPLQGRGAKVRLKYAQDALRALGIVPEMTVLLNEQGEETVVTEASTGALIAAGWVDPAAEEAS